MITVRNRIAECDDGHRREVPLERIARQIHHRITWAKDDGGGGYWADVSPCPTAQLDGPELAARFRDTRRINPGGPRDWKDRPGSYTGGENPYGLLITCQLDNDNRAIVDQVLELGDYGPHSRKYSEGLGIAWAGDFRKHPPTAAQWSTGVELGALFLAWGCEVWGHTELPDASSDPTKECPGRRFGIAAFRVETQGHAFADLSMLEAERELLKLGVVF